jgi:uncharacterized protein with PIN domain
MTTNWKQDFLKVVFDEEWKMDIEKMKVNRCPKCGTRLIFETKEGRTFYIFKENGEKEKATHYCVKCDVAFNS